MTRFSLALIQALLCLVNGGLVALLAGGDWQTFVLILAVVAVPAGFLVAWVMSRLERWALPGREQ